MQIEIDFDVFKALTSLRESEADSYNSVLRRVLSLPGNSPQPGISANALADQAFKRVSNATQNALAAFSKGGVWEGTRNALLQDGAWFDNTFFPNGTRFYATYKGQRFTAEIRDGRWIGSDGVIRTSPSAAAGAISNTNVNGWRFWYAQLPGNTDWRRLDEFKS